MKPCKHFVTQSGPPVCHLGITPLQCRGCASYQPRLAYEPPLHLVPNPTPPLNEKVTRLSSPNHLPTSITLAQTAIRGGCNCGR